MPKPVIGPRLADRRRVPPLLGWPAFQRRNANLLILAVRHPSYHQGATHKESGLWVFKPAKPHVAGTEERASRSGERNHFLSFAKSCPNRRLI